MLLFWLQVSFQNWLFSIVNVQLHSKLNLLLNILHIFFITLFVTELKSVNRPTNTNCSVWTCCSCCRRIVCLSSILNWNYCHRKSFTQTNLFAIHWHSNSISWKEAITKSFELRYDHYSSYNFPHLWIYDVYNYSIDVDSIRRAKCHRKATTFSWIFC